MTARLFLAGSLAFTLLFNVAWAWPTTWLSIVAAAVCTLIVPAGLTLWSQVPAETMPRRVVRALVMTGVCAAAIITSFSHSVSVLLAAGWTDWTAWSVTGGAELLVALSTMAVHAPRTPIQGEKSDPVQGARSGPVLPVQDAPAAVPVPTADTRTATEPAPRTRDPQPLRSVDPDRSVRFREWVATLPERPSEYAVRQKFGCRQSVAARLLAELDDEADGDETEATG